jgi:hypothetical protein
MWVWVWRSVIRQYRRKKKESTGKGLTNQHALDTALQTIQSAYHLRREQEAACRCSTSATPAHVGDALSIVCARDIYFYGARMAAEASRIGVFGGEQSGFPPEIAKEISAENPSEVFELLEKLGKGYVRRVHACVSRVRARRTALDQ